MDGDGKHNMNGDRLLNADEAAAYLGVPRSAIDWACRTRQLRYYLPANKRRFKRADLDKYLNERAVEAA